LHKQDDTKATRAPKLHKGLGHISWERSAHEIHNLVRGTQPWPGAFTSWRGAMLKILSTEVVRQDLLSGMPGEVVALHKDDFRVRTGDGVLAIKKVHPANGKPMDARAFLSGHRLVPGEVFF
jgi:methionyl-tRNA formyltransferase